MCCAACHIVGTSGSRVATVRSRIRLGSSADYTGHRHPGTIFSSCDVNPTIQSGPARAPDVPNPTSAQSRQSRDPSKRVLLAATALAQSEPLQVTRLTLSRLCVTPNATMVQGDEMKVSGGPIRSGLSGSRSVEEPWCRGMSGQAAHPVPPLTVINSGGWYGPPIGLRIPNSPTAVSQRKYLSGRANPVTAVRSVGVYRPRVVIKLRPGCLRFPPVFGCRGCAVSYERFLSSWLEEGAVPGLDFISMSDVMSVGSHAVEY